MPDHEPISSRLPARTLRAALDQADDAIVIAEASGRIVYANSAVERHMGQRAAELVGPQIIDALTDGGDDHYSGTRVIRTADDMHVRVDFVVSPVRNRSGSMTHVLSIGRIPAEAPSS